MGVDAEQLRLYVIRPTLEFLRLWSEASENLVLGTALVESSAGFIKQVGGGPALGLWQMEPATHDDIWENYLRYQSFLAQQMFALQTPAPITKDSDELIGNLFYGAAMCRLHYRRVHQALPAAANAEGMATYWKRHYNTQLGAGTVAKALPYFRTACYGR